MANMTNGVYRISIDRSLFLGNFDLLPDKADAQRWEIQRINGGNYTIRPTGSEQYLSCANGPPRSLEIVTT